MVDQREYNKRYKQSYELCRVLFQNKLKQLGKQDSYQTEKTIQTVLGSFEVTKLIMNCPYNHDIYTPILQEEIENTRKEFFPDLAKKRFTTLDNLKENEFISAPNDTILSDKITTSYKDIFQQSPQNISSSTLDKYTHKPKNKKRLQLAKKLFPNAHIPDISQLDPLNRLTDQEIINIYKYVLSGIEKKFPKNFLAVDGRQRCRIILKFLCLEINDFSSPDELLKLDEYFLLDNKLLNVLRFFNYSVNQVVLNAFPDIVQPWSMGRIKDNFWEEKQNRISAVKWLVTEKLALDVKQSGKIRVNKSDFSTNGLSYLFNTHYNSVTKALSEAFPLLMPWQISSLPAAYWNSDTIRQAVRWMFRRLNWDINSLPRRFNSKELNRKTFSRFGLSGLFENMFNCNIYKLLSVVYPGKFNEWEFIQLHSKFWFSSVNRSRFSKWIEGKFKINFLEGNHSFSNLQELQDYRFYSSLSKYSKGDLTNLAKDYAQDLSEENRHRILMRKWDKLINRERKTMLQNLLVYGFFYSMVKMYSGQYIERFLRRKRRFSKSLII